MAVTARLMAGFLETVEAFQKHILKKKKTIGWMILLSYGGSIHYLSVFPCSRVEALLAAC